MDDKPTLDEHADQTTRLNEPVSTVTDPDPGTSLTLEDSQSAAHEGASSSSDADTTTSSINTPEHNLSHPPTLGQDPAISSDISSDEVAELKKETIEYAKDFAKTGTSTRKEPSPNLANDKGPYYWWEKQATFESDTWSVSVWEYDSGSWQVQATKVELQNDGKSIMTAYSMRKDGDTSFPGFQVYKEQSDDRYHPAAIEDIVYLNRVLKGLKDLG